VVLQSRKCNPFSAWGTPNTSWRFLNANQVQKRAMAGCRADQI
jgi:hypothetical protein